MDKTLVNKKGNVAILNQHVTRRYPLWKTKNFYFQNVRQQWNIHRLQSFFQLHGFNAMFVLNVHVYILQKCNFRNEWILSGRIRSCKSMQRVWTWRVSIFWGSKCQTKHGSVKDHVLFRFFLAFMFGTLSIVDPIISSFKVLSENIEYNDG